MKIKFVINKVDCRKNREKTKLRYLYPKGVSILSRKRDKRK